MVKHIVFYTLREDCDKPQAIAEIQNALEALNGQIEGLFKLEIRPTLQGAFDYVLYSEFADATALAAYQKDPKHLAVKPLVHGYIAQRAAADYLL